MKKILVLMLVFGCANAATGGAIPLEFNDPIQEQRYQNLLKELRCLVCQNQSLADSNADLAQDLREEVYRLIVGGADNDETIAFLVDRYGDFVRYRPPLQATTLLLWLGPLVLLLLGGLVAVRVILRHRQGTAPALAVEERQRAALLLQVNSEDGKWPC